MKFIQFDQSGHSVFINIDHIVQAKWEPKKKVLSLTLANQTSILHLADPVSSSVKEVLEGQVFRIAAI
ncbi:hypothetical protein [Brevifollis gellanilyticus]|uniref:Uncharacterized protein n=1 Tax=Brevifollis gellanilyticus TaxID=748831 RepID=A0A512M8L8_9BACT|nr:hypothetical protein [Brevifollis gellanilyticus]GEP43084.1 hypothetical protein BGE01nite_23750 [Brevifollis gellanilyticus]